MKNDNRSLSAEILEWKDRSKLIAGVRKLASVTRNLFKDTWNELQKLAIQARHMFEAKGRGSVCPMDKKTEWDDVLSTFSTVRRV